MRTETTERLLAFHCRAGLRALGLFAGARAVPAEQLLNELRAALGG